MLSTGEFSNWFDKAGGKAAPERQSSKGEQTKTIIVLDDLDPNDGRQRPRGSRKPRPSTAQRNPSQNPPAQSAPRGATVMERVGAHSETARHHKCPFI